MRRCLFSCFCFKWKTRMRKQNRTKTENKTWNLKAPRCLCIVVYCSFIS